MLGTMEMGKLVPKVSIPIMISMLVQALYNVVDGIFVAKYSAAALTAVSLAYPIQMLMIAVSTGLGVGFNSLISRKLGEKRAEEARDAAKNGMFTELCGYALFLVFGLLFAKPFFNLFTDDLELQALGGEYLSIVCIFSFGLFFGICFERMMQATGNTVLSMVTQLTGAVINIILDPIMIFGLLGCPAMGIAGAAIATVIGQIGGMTLGLVLNQAKNVELRLHLKGFRPNKTILKGILDVGFPQHHHAVHLLRNECADEHDPAGLRRDGGQRAGRVFQAAVLRVYAGIRPEQRSGGHSGLQLWRADACTRV